MTRLHHLRPDRSTIALGAATLLFGLGTAFITSTLAVSIPLIAAAAVIGLIAVRLRDAREQDVRALRASEDLHRRRSLALETKNWVVRSEVEGCLEDWIQALGRSAALSTDSRVTLYELRDAKWMRRARFSPNLLYLESGRPVIAAGQGVVHKAYLQGEFAIDNLSAFGESPDIYLDEQKSLGINKTIARDFTMKSRSYACLSFGQDGARARPYCVVFESLDANGLDLNTLRDEVLHTDARRVSVRLLKLLQALEPQPEQRSEDATLNSIDQ